MKHHLTPVQLLLQLGILGVLGMTAGCKSGLNVEDIALDPNQVVNYGAIIDGGGGAAEAVVYGQLMPGTSNERSKLILDNEVGDISRCIENLKNLSDDANYKSWVDGFWKTFSGTLPTVNNARTSAASARSLATTFESEVKTSGALEARIKLGEKLVPDNLKGEFNQRVQVCVNGYERLYQTALVLAQSISQKDGLDHLANVENALSWLKNNAHNFPTEAERQTALIAIETASSRIDSVRRFTDGMTQKLKVAAPFNNAVGELQTALNNITTDYVNHVDAAARPAATDHVNDAKAAGTALNALGLSYQGGIENLKDTRGDAKLDALIEKAFTGGTSVILGDFSLDQKTQINDLAELLGTSSVVIMRNDESSNLVIQALASSVVYGVAAKNGLPDVANVVGPKSELMIKSKNDYGMGNEDFERYATSRAEKIRGQMSQDGNYKNVYVVFADNLVSEGANVAAMVDQFIADKGKVIVVTSNTAAYETKGKYFAARDLDLTEAILVGNAALQEYPLKVPTTTVSESVARLKVGLGGNMRLADVAPLNRDAAARVQSLSNPTTSDVRNTVVVAMAAHSVPTHLVQQSGILIDSLPTVRSKMKSNRSYYVSRGGGAPDLDRQMQALAERRDLNRADDERRQEDIIRRLADVAHDNAKAGLRSVKKAAQQKAEERRAAIEANKAAIDVKMNEIIETFMRMKNTAQRCVNGAGADLAQIEAKFPTVMRQSLLDAVFNVVHPAVPAPNIDAAIKGNPTVMGPFNESWASCLIMETAQLTRFTVAIDDVENRISLKLNELKGSIDGCSTKINSDTCLKQASQKIDAFRRFQALRPGNAPGLLADTVDKIDMISDFNVNPALRVPFWQPPLGGVALTAGPAGFGRNIRNNALDVDLKTSHRMLNRHYYIKELLNVIGTSNGSVWLSHAVNQFTDVAQINAIYNGYHQAAKRHIFLKNMLSTFDDNNALLIKARRTVNDSFHKNVEDKIAKIVYNDMVKPLYETVIKRFWSLPIAEIKRFQEPGAGASAARRQVWSDVEALVGLLNLLTTDLNKNFVQQSDGNATVHDPGVTGLYHVMRGVFNLREGMRTLSGHLIGGANNAFDGLDPALVAKITNTIKNPLDDLLIETNLAGKWIAGGVFPGPIFPVIPPPATIAIELWKWFEIAYDLHQFNYFNMQGVPLVGAPGRVYPGWHSLVGGGADPIVHPLEP